MFAAAISPDGNSSKLFDFASADRCVLVGSAHIVEEARRNIALRYPASMGRLTDLIRSIEPCAEPPASLVTWARETGLPDNDAPVLAAAVHARCDVLVTGDQRHFGHLFGTNQRDVHVMTLREAATGRF